MNPSSCPLLQLREEQGEPDPPELLLLRLPLPLRPQGEDRVGVLDGVQAAAAEGRVGRVGDLEMGF